MKNTGAVTCRHNHVHKNAEEARLCNAAWRIALAKKLQINELLNELQPVIARALVRNVRRGL